MPSELEETVRNAKNYRFWLGRAKEWMYLAAFFAAVVVGGNVLFYGANHSESEIVIGGQRKPNKSLYLFFTNPSLWFSYQQNKLEQNYQRVTGEKPKENEEKMPEATVKEISQ